MCETFRGKAIERQTSGSIVPILAGGRLREGATMDLPDALFQEITGLPDLNFGDRDAERRRQPRLSLGKQAVVWPGHGGRGGAVVVTIRDISLGGMSIQLDPPMAPGDWFVACVPRANSRPVRVQCVVQWCERDGKKQYLVGAIFKTLIDPAAVGSPATHALDRIATPRPTRA